MTVQEFVNKYNNVHIDEDGYYGAQCWDLVARYAREVVGCPSFPTVTGGAAGLFSNTAPVILQYFDRVANNPNDANQIPPDGAVIVWGTTWSPPYGHTALKIAGGVGQNMTVIEQNGNNPGGAAYTKSRNYTGVTGWLVPKKGTNVSVTDLSIARILAHGILGRLDAHSGAGDGDLNANHVGEETNGKIWEFFKSPEASQWRDVRLPRLLQADARAEALGKQLSDANGALAGLQAQINDLGKRPTQEQLDTLTKAVTEANDKAVAAQAELEKLQAEKVEAQKTGNAFIRWITDLLTKIKVGN
jgi:hypothetical protein